MLKVGRKRLKNEKAWKRNVAKVHRNKVKKKARSIEEICT